VLDGKGVSKLVKTLPQVLSYCIEDKPRTQTKARMAPEEAWLVLDDASLSVVVQRKPLLFCYNMETNLEPTINCFEECVGLDATINDFKRPKSA
jgi:hypothetical protein